MPYDCYLIISANQLRCRSLLCVEQSQNYTHLYHYIKDRMKDGCPPSKVVDAQSTADHCL